MTRRKKQVNALRGTAVVGDEASEKRFAEITSGRSRWQQRSVFDMQRAIDRRSARSVVLSVGVARKAEAGCLVRQRIRRIALLYAANGDEPGCSSTGREDLGTKVRVLLRER